MRTVRCSGRLWGEGVWIGGVSTQERLPRGRRLFLVIFIFKTTKDSFLQNL